MIFCDSGGQVAVTQLWLLTLSAVGVALLIVAPSSDVMVKHSRIASELTGRLVDRATVAIGGGRCSGE